MKSPNRQPAARSSLDLIEESVHWLRTARPAAPAAYYLGTLPFVLGLLYFWSDMSRSPFADQHLAQSALGMAVLFFWMKLWQAVFVQTMRCQMAANPPPAWSVQSLLRLALVQAILQPFELVPIGFLLIVLYYAPPMGLFLILPVGLILAFFQNVAAVSDGNAPDLKGVIQRAARQWRLEPIHNLHLVFLMAAFGLFVFLDWSLVCWSLPYLIKMLFGIESTFTRSGLSALNTTFFAAMLGLSYLCVDPIMKVIYTLRCFYGESQSSGEDLKSELKRLSAAAQALAPVLAILAALICALPEHVLAAKTSHEPERRSPHPARSIPFLKHAGSETGDPISITEPAAKSAISPPELDRTINQVIHERKYTWRLPHEQKIEPESEKGPLRRFLDRVGNLCHRWAKAALDWFNDVLRRLFGGRRVSHSGGSGYGWIMELEVLLYGLVIVAVAALLFLLYRVWRERSRLPTAVAGEPLQPAPDLKDENVGADQLPETGWLQLARELLDRGELRLAVRAFYLASLAHLAERNLLSIARFKSNRDYARELRRRGHSLPDLVSAFEENLSAFEPVWYGAHEVTGELVSRFARNVERIKAAG